MDMEIPGFDNSLATKYSCWYMICSLATKDPDPLLEELNYKYFESQSKACLNGEKH
uniref:Uncharacterized protein n=1 Tax=Arion vulgaris TaxID=1028688 RepID=A0A0B6YDK5_9EUPU